MVGELSFDPFAERNAADREAMAEADAFLADHDALEHLGTELALAFIDADADADGVSDLERREILLHLLFFESLDQTVCHDDFLPSFFFFKFKRSGRCLSVR